MINKYRFKTEPYAHQRAALGASWDKPEFAYFMEMGTGKSKVLLDNVALLYDYGHIDSALIVAPKGVYKNWAQIEIPKHLPDHIHSRVVCWSPNPTKDEKEQLLSLFEITEDLVLFVVNIEAFSTKKGVGFVEKFLLSHHPLFAIDESTTIKNPSAQRTKATIKLGKLAKFHRILTGFPVTKSPLDLYSQCAFLDEALLGFSSFYAYRNHFAMLQKRSVATHSFQQIVGYQNLDELKGLLGNFSFRVLKKDCLDLPDKIYTTRTIELTPEQKRIYKELKDYAIAELEDTEFVTTNSVITQILRLQQVLCGFTKTDSGDFLQIPSTRIKELLATLEEVEGKCIIWANYQYDIQTIEAEIAKAYTPSSVASYYGQTPANDRPMIVDAFQDPASELRFFVGQPRTGGFGLTLTAANTVIYYSNSYDLETRLQSEDRAHRIGQTNKVTYIDFYAPKTVDEKILKSLRSKINLATQVLGEDYREWLL
jgi:SNF2 family DNA or RNA helicase|tara:strand:- start:340 stop:1785 length:1446 start_codon:yes stop_codon:yes gene_type:complete